MQEDRRSAFYDCGDIDEWIFQDEDVYVSEK